MDSNATRNGARCTLSPKTLRRGAGHQVVAALERLVSSYAVGLLGWLEQEYIAGRSRDSSDDENEFAAK